MMQLTKAGTSDVVVINSISKRAFELLQLILFVEMERLKSWSKILKSAERLFINGKGS